VSRNIMQYIRF